MNLVQTPAVGEAFQPRSSPPRHPPPPSVRWTIRALVMAAVWVVAAFGLLTYQALRVDPWLRFALIALAPLAIITVAALTLASPHLRVGKPALGFHLVGFILAVPTVLFTAAVIGTERPVRDTLSGQPFLLSLLLVPFLLAGSLMMRRRATFQAWMSAAARAREG